MSEEESLNIELTGDTPPSQPITPLPEKQQPVPLDRKTQRIINMVSQKSLRGEILRKVPCKKEDLDRVLEEHPELQVYQQRAYYLTDEQKATIERCALLKMKTKDIAREAQCNISTVREHVERNPKLQEYKASLRHSLTYDQRVLIAKGKKRKKSNKEIAREVGCHSETIGQELKRYSKDGKYSARAAHLAAKKKVKQTHKKRLETLRSIVMY